MASLRPADIDRFLQKPDFTRSVILVYGPDTGLVSERAEKLSKASGVDPSDPFNLTRLDADIAAADSSRISDEAYTVALFGGSRLIRISGSTRRDLARAIEPVLDNPPENTIIVIEAGDLRKNSALRKKVESSKNGLTIPCYLDNDRSISQLIDEEITDTGIRIDSDSRQALTAMLGSDRRLSRNELRKLATYCMDRKQVTIEDIHSIIGDTSAMAVNDVADAASTGDLEKLQLSFSKAVESGSPADLLLLGVLKHFQHLQAMKHRLIVEKKAAAALIESMRPPVHFSRKPALIQSLQNWPPERIGHVMNRLNGSMLECRQQVPISMAIARQVLLAVGTEARRHGKSRGRT